MKRSLQCFLALLLLWAAPASLRAEKPADLPIPSSYVNDYAHVLTPAGAQKIEDLCLQLQQKADAQVFVVTIKTLDDDMTKEEFTSELEEKWKAGKKGEDRAAILLLVLAPRGTRIETGYGLEGILNDAKVGAILDQADPIIKTGDYDNGLYAGVQGLASVIAADKGVTLTAPVHRYRYATDTSAPPQKIGVGQILLGIGAVILLLILIKTGHIGWAIYLVMSLMGGGGGRGGGGGDDEGGGFGGIGGGSSGGGGASRDF